MVNQENTNNDRLHQRWRIDLDWCRKNGCSLFVLAQDCLCPRCREQLKGETGESEVIQTITSCCSKRADFITPNMPILASIFRLLLANGNQPLDLKELSAQLTEHRRGNTQGTSPETLSRILKNDRYYGLHPLS